MPRQPVDEYGAPIDRRPVEPSPLFDTVAAEASRDAAIEAVGDAAPEAWKVSARALVMELAMSGRTFTADDVWDLLHQRKAPAPPEPRALGAVVLAVAREGKIVGTGNYVASKIPNRHARPVREWIGDQRRRNFE